MICNFPNVLCIQLKRFSYDRPTNKTIKLHTSIIIEPERTLNLSYLHYLNWLGLTNLSVSYQYRLIAVCLYLSETKSSACITHKYNEHYVCLYRMNQNQWFLGDDEHIIEIKQIENLCQSSYVTENCYLLFYERCL